MATFLKKSGSDLKLGRTGTQASSNLSLNNIFEITDDGSSSPTSNTSSEVSFLCSPPTSPSTVGSTSLSASGGLNIKFKSCLIGEINKRSSLPPILGTNSLNSSTNSLDDPPVLVLPTNVS